MTVLKQDLVILQSGNTIECEGFKLIFPPNAFPNSSLQILLQDMTPYLKDLYEETAVSTQDAISINDNDITYNQYTFIVNNDPFESISDDISYVFTLPIPESISNSCGDGDEYGYEIFMYSQQQETDDIDWPVMPLIDSSYDPISKSLTAELFPEIWMNKTAEFVISCTPGSDISASSINTDNGGRRRRRLIYETAGICNADPIYSPLQGDRIITKEFNPRRHIGVDYAVNNDNILAVANGTIYKSGDSQFYGPRIVLKHDQGTEFKTIIVCFKIVSKSISTKYK